MEELVLSLGQLGHCLRPPSERRASKFWKIKSSGKKKLIYENML